MKSTTRCLILVLFLIGFHHIEVSAQDSVVAPRKWHYLAEPYLMLANMAGTMGLGRLPDSKVEANVGDILGHLKFGAMLYFEAYSDKWAISSDLIYMKLGQDVRTGPIINSGEVTAKQFAWEVAGLRTLIPLIELGVGLRLNSLNSELDLNHNSTNGPTQSAKSLTETWVDPIIVGRTKLFFLDSLLFTQARADIGGFGIGSDLAWQIQINFGLRISKTLQASLGYRIISIDYEHDSDENRFLYDMDIFGPVIRFGIKF